MAFYVDWDNIFTNSLFFNVVSTYSVINWIFLVLVRARIQNTSKCYIVFINKDVDKNMSNSCYSKTEPRCKFGRG